MTLFPAKTGKAGEMEKETKSFSAVATKVLDADQGIVEHYVAVMGNIDRGGDIIHPGAFAKSIMERGLKVKVLDQHNTQSVRNIVGKPLALREVGRLELPDELLKQYPDATGALWVKTQFLLNTPEGRGVFDRIKAGAVDEYSIGYDPITTDFATLEMPEGKQTVRNLRECRLWEYSPVVFAMNPAAQTLSAKDAAPAESKPKPEPGESEEDWMGRCVPVRIEEGNDRDQAVAVCISMYRDRKAEDEDDTEDDEDEDLDDEEKRKRRRRRRMPAAGTGSAGIVALGQAAAADDPEEVKAGRRVRRERLERARAACKELLDFLAWADYDDEAPPTQEAALSDTREPETKDAAGPDIPPTAEWQKLVRELELSMLQLEVGK